MYIVGGRRPRLPLGIGHRVPHCLRWGMWLVMFVLMTDLRHYDNSGTARFVTFGCYRWQPALTTDLARQLFIQYLDFVRERHNFQLLAYVIMPEHVHLVLYPPEGMKLGYVIGELKSRMAREYFARMAIGIGGARRVFWQKRCYDHNCRTPDAVREKIEYCHNNPVRRGLVASSGEWRWSSYNWYSGSEDVPIAMDEVAI